MFFYTLPDDIKELILIRIINLTSVSLTPLLDHKRFVPTTLIRVE
jgi:hypothetical protein